MDIKVSLQTITIKDNQNGKEFTVRTLRTAEEIAGCIEESEKDFIIETLDQKVCEQYGAPQMATSAHTRG